MNLSDALFMTNAVPAWYKNNGSEMKARIDKKRGRDLTPREKRHLSFKGDDISGSDEDCNEDRNYLICRDDVTDEFETNSIEGGGSVNGSVLSTGDNGTKNYKCNKKSKSSC